MVTCIRASYGLSVFFGIVRIRTSTLRVPYGARVSTVRALVDALRACKHPYENRHYSVVTARAPVRGPQEPRTVVLKAEPYGAVTTHRGPLRARTWFISL